MSEECGGCGCGGGSCCGDKLDYTVEFKKAINKLSEKSLVDLEERLNKVPGVEKIEFTENDLVICYDDKIISPAALEDLLN